MLGESWSSRMNPWPCEVMVLRKDVDGMVVTLSQPSQL